MMHWLTTPVTIPLWEFTLLWMAVGGYAVMWIHEITRWFE
jgi:hypothetical protein